MSSKQIVAPGYKYIAEIDGDDVVVYNTTATWFGGADDPLDDGQTASGVMTKGNPNLLGCALAVIPGVHSTANSPFTLNHPSSLHPVIPWKTPVIVKMNALSVTCELIDNGPARSAGDGIDLTQVAFEQLGGNLKTGVIPVSYRILGAAKYYSHSV